MKFLNDPLQIGSLVLKNRVFLAPMSGVTDLPFRQRAWAAGAGMVVSEMIASGELCTERNQSLLRLQGDHIDFHVVQLAGRHPEWMVEAAKFVEDSGAHMIDINMGCPAKKVVGGYSGAALMRDVPLALSLIESVIKAVNIPVSLKMRLGWDDTHLNAPELAALAEQAGVVMITVHGRTRMQFYNGEADWSAVRRVRDKISLPLVVNGDIACQQTAENALKASGADAVMVGRACYGQPWLAGQIAGASAQAFNLVDYIKEHYQAMLAHYGEVVGIRHARKHLDWYIQKHANLRNPSLRTQLMAEKTVQNVLDILDEIFADTGSIHKVA